MSFVLVDTTRTPTPAGEAEDEDGDKATQKDREEGLRNEEQLITPILNLNSGPFPPSSPPRNFVEKATEMENSNSASPTPTSTENTRRGAQEENERTEVVAVVKIVDTTPGHGPSGRITDVDHISSTNAEGRPVLSPIWEVSSQQQKQSFKSDPPIKPNICEVCGHGFVRKDSLLRHVRRLHSDGKQYECETCKMKFFYPYELRRHTRIHIGNSDELKKCLECGAGFNQFHALSLHYRVMHTLKENSHSADMDDYDNISVIRNDPLKMKYRCNGCGSVFSSKQLIPHHQFCDKKEDEGFTSKTCGNVFSLNSNLEQHKTVAHCGERRFLCETCKISFTRHINLKYHIIMHHTGDKLAKCSECGGVFNNKRTLILHLRAHKEKDGYQSFKRRECREEAKNEVYFCDHLFSHADESSSTPNLQDGGSDNSVDVSLSPSATPTFTTASHLRTHSKKKPVLRDRDLCNAPFPSSLDLCLQEKSHVPGHNAEAESPPRRQFQCQFCEKSYMLKQSLNRHIRLKHNKPKMLLKSLDATNTVNPVLSDRTTTMMDQENDDTGTATATATSFLHLDSPILTSPPPPQQNFSWNWDYKVNDLAASIFPSFLQAVEPQPVEVPEWNLLIPDSHPHPVGMANEEDFDASKLLQQQQLIPPMALVPPDGRMFEDATVFVVELIPVAYIPTDEVFLVDSYSVDE